MNLENGRGIRGVERLQRLSLYLLALSLLCGVQKGDNLISVMYWETIARNLKKRGWSSGYVSAVVICSNPRVQLAPRLPQRLLPRLLLPPLQQRAVDMGWCGSTPRHTFITRKVLVFTARPRRAST